MTVSVNSLSGCDFAYDYRMLPSFLMRDEKRKHGLHSYCQKVRTDYGRIADDWSNERLEEWLIREYLALKLIMASTIILGSAEHSVRHNINITVPYLHYYSTLNCMRAALFTSPTFEWEGRKSIELSHSNTLNRFQDLLARLVGGSEASKYMNLPRKARFARELLSYRFPTTGLITAHEYSFHTDVVEDFCTLAAEIALFNSSCLASIIQRKGKDSQFSADPSNLKLGFEYELRSNPNSTVLLDTDDWSRIEWICRKFSAPEPIIFIVGEGGVDDFFASWAPDEDSDGAPEYHFDPDEHWDRLLNLP